MTAISPGQLPALLQTVARVTSIDVAIAIARQLGAQRMYLPREPGRGHPLAKLIGIKAARLIARQIGGDHILWPSAKALLRQWEAIEMRRGGASIGDIATKLGINARHVQRLVAGVEKGARTVGHDHEAPTGCPVCGHRPRVRVLQADDRQPSLFDLLTDEQPNLDSGRHLPV